MFNTIKCLVCGLLLTLSSGCLFMRKAFPNPQIADAADLWVSQEEIKTGRWSKYPGNSGILVRRIDSIECVFPPLSYLDTVADLSSPLHLAPGKHSLELIVGSNFQSKPQPGYLPGTVQTRGTGTIEYLFIAKHAYRVTAEWNSGSRPGNGTFKIYLWDITQNENPDNPMQSWTFRGWEDWSQAENAEDIYSRTTR